MKLLIHSQSSTAAPWIITPMRKYAMQLIIHTLTSLWDSVKPPFQLGHHSQTMGLFTHQCPRPRGPISGWNVEWHRNPYPCSSIIPISIVHSLWTSVPDWTNANLCRLVSGGVFPWQGPMMGSFQVSFIVSLSKLLNNSSICRRFETQWRSCDVTIVLCWEANSTPIFLSNILTVLLLNHF